MMTNDFSLVDVSWKEFFIGGKDGVFNISATKSGIDKNKLNLEEGNIPYITRSDIDNGINLFVTNKQESKYTINKGNVITIGLDTQTVFYQKNSFLTGQNVQILENKELNKYNSLFIIPLLKTQMKKFNWGGNGATLTRLNKTKILLPVDSYNKPNWEFMENYIKQKQKSLIEKLISYYEGNTNKNNFLVEDLKQKEWKVFPLNMVFKVIQRGKRLKKDDHIEGDSVYVSSTSLNNGVDGFIGNKDNIRKFRKNLSLANSGSVGSCFYHQYEYVASDHVTALTLLNPDKHVYLFMASIIKRLEEKYSFNREINDKRIKREKILLPVNKNGEPDFDYMKKYIQKIEIEKQRKIVSYYQNILEP